MPSGHIRQEVDQQYKQKAAETVTKLTLEEKILQMVHGASEVSRLGIPAYNWWNEALHGVARAGVATVFPQAIGLAATFDPVWLEKVADIISTEGRAKYEAASRRGDRDIYKGLTFWSPNINIFRDPRWGRGHETYGEDPFLTAELGKAFIEGIQGKDDQYLKAAACAKHYAVHSGPEGLRHEFNAIASDKDLWETYLYAFEDCVVDGQVESVMGAYNRTNDDACCAHPYLIEEVLRGLWQFDGHFVSDCWAIKDMNGGHGLTSSLHESSALAVKRGCDLNCGNAYLTLMSAVDEGLLEEKDIDLALTRLLTARYRLGLLGDAGKTPYENIPYSVVDCDEHREINLETARRSLVLLKNDGLLPLSREKIKTLAIIGPNADSRDALLGNYNGTPNNAYTPLRGFTEEVLPDTRILYAEGCHLFRKSMTNLSQPADRIAEARACMDEADAVILCLGLDAMLEGEEGDTGNEFASGDKPDLNLPGLQNRLLEEAAASGKPLVLVVMAGSALAINTAEEKAHAVIQAWYPGGMGGKAIAQLVFGDYSPSARLPVTFNRTSDELPEFTDYAMTGRTYRYMEQEALYPFGYGLSYTQFTYQNLQTEALVRGSEEPVSQEAILSDRNLTAARVQGEITNTGERAGREVIQLYVKATNAPDETLQPKYQLRGVCSVYLEPGETKTIAFDLSAKHLWQYDEQAKRYLMPGEYTVFVGGSQPDNRSRKLTGQELLQGSFRL